MAQCPAYRILLVAGCLLHLVSGARAQDKGQGTRRAAALHWVRLPGAEKCSGGDALSQAVEAKLRREVFPAPRNASVLIEGHVEPAAPGYRAQLQMRSTNGVLLGSRELSSAASDCTELSETIAVVLAVMIDPEAATRGAAFKPPAEPTPEAPVPKEDAKRDDGHAQRLLGFTRLGLNVLPATTIGFGFGYELALGGFGGLRVEGAGFKADKEVRSIRGTMLFKLAYAGLSYCPLWFTTGRLRSAACAGGELGVIVTEGSGFPQNGPAASKAWMSGSLGARFALRLIGPFEVHLGAGAVFPITRYKYEPVSQPEQIRTEPVAVALDLGLGTRF